MVLNRVCNFGGVHGHNAQDVFWPRIKKNVESFKVELSNIYVKGD